MEWKRKELSVAAFFGLSANSVATQSFCVLLKKDIPYSSAEWAACLLRALEAFFRHQYLYAFVAFFVFVENQGSSSLVLWPGRWADRVALRAWHGKALMSRFFLYIRLLVFGYYQKRRLQHGVLCILLPAPSSPCTTVMKFCTKVVAGILVDSCPMPRSSRRVSRRKMPRLLNQNVPRSTDPVHCDSIRRARSQQ